MPPLPPPSIPTRMIRAVTVEWRKSSRSGTGGCVEVAAQHDRRLVRDSKLGEKSPALVVSADGFAAVLRDVQAGRLG